MCRWLAYKGAQVYLEKLIFDPQNSLASQSLSAQHSNWPTNGDGFGVGWYGGRAQPGLFRDVLPAWNDSNLRNVSAQIESRLFFAHVRASTGTSTSRTNCHPFRHKEWLFMHNGQIGGFERIRRDLMMRVESALFRELQGTTDSELFFYLLLGNGAADDPIEAFRRTVSDVLEVMEEHQVSEPFRMSAALSDGDCVHAIRYASDAQAPSLFYGAADTLVQADGVLVASEPLGIDSGPWQEIPQSHWLRVDNAGIESAGFTPR
jgi:predicted glutamine amidotransferase